MAMTIVVVDDDPQITSLLEFAFKSKGFQVFSSNKSEDIVFYAQALSLIHI